MCLSIKVFENTSNKSKFFETIHCKCRTTLHVKKLIRNGVFFIEIIKVVNKNQEMAPQLKIYAGNALQYTYIYTYRKSNRKIWMVLPLFIY